MYSWLQPSMDKLCSRAQQHKLHHGLLLQGVRGIGKTEFARQLGGYLLCSKPLTTEPCNLCQSCHLLAAGNHPDLYEIESDKQIGVDVIRESIKKLSGSAQLSGAKVLLIHAAHTMTESSANALLKTLEEPTNNTFLILLSDKPERLLATIVSRCEKVSLHSPAHQDCLSWLVQQGFQSPDLALVELYANSPLVLLEQLKTPPVIAYQDLLDGISELRQGKMGTAELANKWQEHAETVIRWLQFWLAKQIKQSTHASGELWDMHGACINATVQLAQSGINKTLLLANILQKLPK